MAARRGLLWLLLVALVAAQTLGLMHRVVHLAGTGEPMALVAQGLHSHQGQAGARGWMADLFSSHDDSGCRDYDQLGHGGMVPDVPAVPLPALAPAFILLWFQGEYLARWAALFDARGPPSVR